MTPDTKREYLPDETQGSLLKPSITIGEILTTPVMDILNAPITTEGIKKVLTTPISLGLGDSVRDDVEEVLVGRNEIKTGVMAAIYANGDPRGFNESYSEFIKSEKYKRVFSGLQNDLENYETRLDFHSKYISENLFTEIFSNPDEIVGVLSFFIEFISDPRNLHENAKSQKGGMQMRINNSKNGTRMRIKHFDKFFFSILSRYQSESQENKIKILNGLIKFYKNSFPDSIGDGPARGFIGTLIYTISELEGNPRPEFIKIGQEGDPYAGFGLHITKRNAELILSGKDIKKLQLCFSHFEGDVGISNLRFFNASGQFSRFKKTLNANEEKNWYSGTIEKLSVTFYDNAGAFSWVTDSFAYGRAIKNQSNNTSSENPVYKDKFTPGISDTSTPGPLGYSIFDGNQTIPHFEFTTGGRNCFFLTSPRNLIVGSDNQSQKDNYVLYGAKFEESLNSAFVYRGMTKCFFRSGFMRVFVLSGLEEAHFENAGLSSVFISSKDRAIGENATWNGNSFRECIFFGPQCFSDTLKISKEIQQDSLHGSILINGALNQRIFSGNTGNEAQFIESAHGSTFQNGAAAQSIIFPKSLENSVVEDGTFFLSTIFGGFKNSEINGGFHSSKISKDIGTIQILLSQVREELKRKTNIGYENKAIQGNHNPSYSKTCESIIAQKVQEMEAWIDEFQIDFKNFTSRIPFVESNITGEAFLDGAFIPKDKIFIDELARIFPKIENPNTIRSKGINTIEDKDLQKLIIGK